MRIAVTGTRGIPGIQGGVETHCEELFPRLASLNMRSYYLDVLAISNENKISHTRELNWLIFLLYANPV